MLAYPFWLLCASYRHGLGQRKSLLQAKREQGQGEIPASDLFT